MERGATYPEQERAGEDIGGDAVDEEEEDVLEAVGRLRHVDGV